MNVHTSMIYPWIHGLRFKPQVNNNLAFMEITEFSGFHIGEPYLIQSERIDSYNHPLKLKGTFVKIFQGNNMTYILFKNIKGQIFSAPAQHSRFYKSPERVIIEPRLRQLALMIAINNAYGYARPNGDKEADNTNIENTVGYCLGNGWIAAPDKK
uniref:Uncharacterized protein n=1 Tax=viral metagenome TaxID=1070528 RepID=A0A6C0HB70_9ZZZZ